MFPSSAKKSSKIQVGVASKVVGAVALGVSAAVVALRAIDRFRKQMRAKVRAALKPRLSKEDHEAIARMEGEGGPSRPLPPPASTAL